MSGRHNIFEIENCLDELFETVYPIANVEPKVHPSGRAYKLLFGSSLGSLVPDGDRRRILQGHRQYFKIDFQDFIDYATSDLPRRAQLTDIPDQTAVFYDSLRPRATSEREVHATWTNGSTTTGLSILDAAIARDRVFTTVIMRLAHLNLSSDDHDAEGKSAYGSVLDIGGGRIAEYGVTLTFAPGEYDRRTGAAGPLNEWERSIWWPAVPDDPEWRLKSSGEYLAHILDELESDPAQTMCSPLVLRKLRVEQESRLFEYRVFFELARLGLHLPSYIDFMYDLIVSERKLAGSKTQWKGPRGSKKRARVTTPVYKVISSINIIRPEHTGHPQSTRHWSAPRYSFLVRGHWRAYDDPSKEGRDADGKPVNGKTWVRGHRKYENQPSEELTAEVHLANPEVVIGIKQTLSYARDIIKSHADHVQDRIPTPRQEAPSDEWKAKERSKLTAGLRYAILRRDNFRCRLCGRSATDENFVKLEVDHETPVSRWGLTEEKNLRTVCRDCNRGKADLI